MKAYFPVFVSALFLPFSAAQAHGIAGDRFLPATLVVEDPFVADELNLPQVEHFKEAEDGTAAWNDAVEVEFAKRITKNFGLSLGAAYLHRHAEDANSGFDNIELGAKYQLFTSAEHEFVFSLAVDADLGGTGSRSAGAESFSTITPGILFGKGFGDLPDSVPYLKPLAITGSLGVAMPTRDYSTIIDPDTLDAEREYHQNMLEWGFTLQYSLPYLDQHVKHMTAGAPFNHMIPVVEFAFKTPLDHGGGKTTGTINPGIIWAGQSTQLALEAIVPMNNETGEGVGVRGHLHFYLDDIFPNSLGKPIWND